MKSKLRRDDTVQIIAGKDKGKTGRLLRVDSGAGSGARSGAGRVIVQQLNMSKKAVKPRRQNEKGGIIDVEAPLDISNVMIVCKKCGPTRIGISLGGNEKVRVCRKCGEAL